MSSDRLGSSATDPAVLSGQAVIAGTRVPASVVLDCLATGMSPEEVVAEYPTLTSEGVQGRRRVRRHVTPSADLRIVDPIGYVHASSPARSPQPSRLPNRTRSRADTNP